MKYTILLAWAFLLVACSTSPTTDVVPVQELIPLRVGEAWVLDFETSPGQLQSDTLSVIKAVVLNEHIWYELKSSNTLIQRELGGLYSNQQDGVHKIRIENDEQVEFVLFKPNIKSGSSFLVVKNAFDIISTFVGEMINNGRGLITQTYVHEFDGYSVESEQGVVTNFNLDQTYSFSREIAPEIGFIEWESGIFEVVDDSTLTLVNRFSFTLQQYVAPKTNLN